MHYERLTATDATFLRIETPHEPQHVGSLSVLEGGPLRDGDGRVRFDELRDHVDRRIHRVPRLRQRVMEVRYGQGRPVWIDDDAFDIDFHVRLTSLPRPGDDAQLSALMSRLQSLPLDRARPLWEMWFVDGLDGDDVGLVIKTHHSLGDGIANVDLALALVDLEPAPAADDEPPAWTPRPAPSPQRLLADTVADQLSRPMRLTGSAVRALRDPRPFVEATANVARTLVSFAAKPDRAPWNVPVSPHRRWVHADVSFELALDVKERYGVTINDVVLAACSGALRTFLRDHDAETDGRVLKAMVPVSTRGEDEHGDTLGNKVSLIVVELPVDEADPVRRLERVHAATRELKGSGLVDGADTIIRLADGITPLAVPLTRLVSRQIPMNVVITNIPGPPVPLYLRGAEVRRTYPYVEVIDDEGLTIAVVSYQGQLFFGVTSDRDVLPDLDRVAEGIEKEFAALGG
ncbi:MAG: wax ester/triacylglycerol synthase family O-acyltransferase [Ilumatobacter sp.]|uniref:wax ester/triacylglycerol synthase family O-acyltransferase n=1 Tax=Ilumatobacter sp. TaxID=1967498 RepID=UPI0026035720|nr:wax ester/triacylglycerol synthase family O-acyltransferase [Ilumatobacter sp.]MDJ0768028.1 wax ester/triacylglycerol synthase family O-acyltransferase [Ilumatobacter sp.]